MVDFKQDLNANKRYPFFQKDDSIAHLDAVEEEKASERDLINERSDSPKDDDSSEKSLSKGSWSDYEKQQEQHGEQSRQSLKETGEKSVNNQPAIDADQDAANDSFDSNEEFLPAQQAVAIEQDLENQMQRAFPGGELKIDLDDGPQEEQKEEEDHIIVVQEEIRP